MAEDRELQHAPTPEFGTASEAELLATNRSADSDTSADPDASLAADVLPPPPTGWTDVLTGTDGPRYWDRVVTSEQARIRRHRRPSTVVLAEVVGLDALARRWGHEVAERMFVKLARALAGEVRSSDYIARIERTRLAIYLTETNEIAAINFVERARASCEAQLGLARDDVRIGIGWASPPAKGDLSEAFEIATERLAADLALPA